MDNKPRVNLKILGVGVLTLTIVIFVAVLAVNRIKNPTQHVEDEEPNLEFVAEDSKVAGVQELLGYGLTADQYTFIVDSIEAYFEKKYPEFKYINYKKDSLTFETSADDVENYAIDPELEAAIDADAVNVSDATEEVFISEEEKSGELRGDDGIGSGILVFTLVSDTNEEFSVKIDLKERLPSVKIESLMLK